MTAKTSGFSKVYLVDGCGNKTDITGFTTSTSTADDERKSVVVGNPLVTFGTFSFTCKMDARTSARFHKAISQPRRKAAYERRYARGGG